jgi:hypothetical protein
MFYQMKVERYRSAVVGLVAAVVLAGCMGPENLPSTELATRSGQMFIQDGGGGTTCTPYCPAQGACGAADGCGGTCTPDNSKCLSETYFQTQCNYAGGCWGVNRPPDDGVQRSGVVGTGVDSDKDGLSDAFEWDLMTKYAPMYTTMGGYAEDRGSFYPYNGHVIPVHVGIIYLAPGVSLVGDTGNFIEIRYGMAYDMDFGQYGVVFSGYGPTWHQGDSEVFALLLDMNGNLRDDWGSAHGMGNQTGARWPSRYFTGVVPTLPVGPRVARWKHGNYNGYNGCNSTCFLICDSCTDTGYNVGSYITGRLQNVGEPNQPYQGFSSVIRTAYWGGPYNVWTNTNGFGSSAATDYAQNLRAAQVAPGYNGYSGLDIQW